MRKLVLALAAAALATPALSADITVAVTAIVEHPALDAARLAANTRCHNVVVLDVSNISPVCDYFVIATGTSARQMRSVADDLLELAETRGFAPLNQSGLEGQTWILVDCIDVIIHIFSDEARQYYALDNLWGDAKSVGWEDSSSPSQ